MVTYLVCNHVTRGQYPYPPRILQQRLVNSLDNNPLKGPNMDRQQAAKILAKKIISDVISGASDEWMLISEMLEEHSLDNDEVIDEVRSEMASFSDSVCPYDSKISEAVEVLSA